LANVVLLSPIGWGKGGRNSVLQNRSFYFGLHWLVAKGGKKKENENLEGTSSN
jgi:hypothetical protein